MATTLTPRPAAIEPGGASPILQCANLRVRFAHAQRSLEIVRGVSLEVNAGETLGIVGESGSGKSVTIQSLCGITTMRGGRASWDQLTIDGHDVPDDRERTWRPLRGKVVSMIFQNAARALNPAIKVGDQVAEVVRRHTGVSRAAAADRAIGLLTEVGIDRPRERSHDYPHTFSGGMCQRVAIALALAAEPRVLLADEPTTALDVTVQSVILELLRTLQQRHGFGMIFISHDLAVINEVADRVSVMYAGQFVESGTSADIFDYPAHPYAHGLVNSTPRRGERLRGIPGKPPARFDDTLGCAFAPRCPHVTDDCHEPLQLVAVGERRSVRCVHPFVAGRTL